MAHSGYRGDEKPQAFFINDKKITVVEILDMWIEEDLHDRTRKRFFIMKGLDMRRYKLYRDESTMAWFCEV
ncbi:MAG TPA: hypothetical protein VEI28_03755 [Thermodesulfovibrionales bacterium]|nr:hypothetical protein [Thermodesulfovibrionales bacterium]